MTLESKLMTDLKCEYMQSHSHTHTHSYNDKNKHNIVKETQLPRYLQYHKHRHQFSHKHNPHSPM